MKELEEIAKVIKEYERFGITSHLGPEGDSIGSQLALRLILENLGKEAVIVNRDSPPQNLRFLPMADKILKPSEFIKAAALPLDAWFVVDCGDLSRVGEEIQNALKSAFIINIDHHLSNPGFGHINHIKPVASTCQIIYELAHHLGVPISKELADCIYTGIVADTDSFRNANVSPDVLRTAAELLAYGADPRRIAIQLYERRGWSELKLLSYVLANAQLGDGIIWSAISKEVFAQLGASVNDTERLVEELRAAEGIEVAVLFKELDNGKIKVSFRSKDRFSVDGIARAFGGGGHEKAAGCLLTGKLSEVEAAVLEELRRRLK